LAEGETNVAQVHRKNVGVFAITELEPLADAIATQSQTNLRILPKSVQKYSRWSV